MTRCYENFNNGKWIIIDLEEEVNRFDFIQVFKVLKNEFKDEELEFVGWLKDSKVISIDGLNYIVIAFDKRIKLKLTTDKRVKVPDKKKTLFEKYSTEILKDQ